MTWVRSLFVVVVPILLAPVIASARGPKLEIGIPMSGQVKSEASVQWRDAGGRRGQGTSISLSGLTAPIRLRGTGSASSGGRAFPLPADIVRHDGKLYAIVQLDMDRYLQGVVPFEMSPGWPTEALKAQTVVARTFAVRRSRVHRNAGRPFDLVAGTVDQEYRWQQAPGRLIEQVVSETRGLVLQQRGGAVADVYYHSCCGGNTAAADEIWTSPVPGIRPVSDPHCTVCPNYFWNVQLTPAQLGQKAGIGPVVEVNVTQRGPSGRVVRIQLSDDNIQKELTGQEFRRAIGPTVALSTLFRIRADPELDGGSWVVDGSGSGHGVGLCQFGAMAMAEAGSSFRDILEFYFPDLKTGSM